MAKRRKRGDGSVHLRKDGRWEGRVVIGYDDNGYPKTKNVLAKNKKECLQKLKVLKDSLKKVEPERLSSDMCLCSNRRLALVLVPVIQPCSKTHIG